MAITQHKTHFDASICTLQSLGLTPFINAVRYLFINLSLPISLFSLLSSSSQETHHDKDENDEEHTTGDPNGDPDLS